MDDKNRHRLETYTETKKKLFYKIYKKIITSARNKFFNIFKDTTEYSDDKSVIDIGTTPSLDVEHNIFLEKTKNNHKITCLSNQNCEILKKKYPNLKEIVVGDGKKTNLPDNSFEIVHSNATIEHLGSLENQLLFVKECLRISEKYVFIQTPNRFYPIDFHTTLPLIHWLPKNLHRKILKIIGLEFYSLEKNLNLLSENDIKNICKELNIHSYQIIKHKLFMLTSNLVLIIKK